MEKYERHGLTRTQDDILGSFGMSEDLSDTLRNEAITSEQREAVKHLIKKGLLESHVRDDLSIEFRLTPQGKSLFRIRSKEEEEGTAMSDEVHQRIKAQHVRDIFRR